MTDDRTPGETRPITHITPVQPTNSESDGTLPQSGTPSFIAQDPELPAVPGYVVSREVARGGMAVVYAAHDPVFGREVAIKVTRDGQNARRFVVEAKVTAQLSHPGIPPVYALGTLADDRPLLAMKLIEGRTLADELAASTPSDLPRLLGAFEQICQTVGFAHAQGIIHRDLKPANVMVGSFGEVLVMDWGLAREVRSENRGARNEIQDASGGNSSTPSSEFRAPNFEETEAGQVKGTPAYMAPEQARGEPVDARADVFALGGILATLLTGKPPFLSDTVKNTVQKAAVADLGDCFGALDACGADAELVAMAKRCLSASPGQRYADGAAVAAAVAAYRTGVEDRLRRAERDRAAAEARAEEEVNTRREAEARQIEGRKRRRLQLITIAVMVAFTVASLATWQWFERREDKRQLAQIRDAAERRETEARLEGERDAEARNKAKQAQDGVSANLKLATDLRKQFKFQAAAAALALAVELAKGGAPELLPTVEQSQRDLAFVAQLDDIRYRKWVWIGEPGGQGDFNTKIASPEYHKAFAARGLPLDTLDVNEAARRVSASAVKAELIAAIDDWALYEEKDSLRDRLLAIARTADAGQWTDRLRNAAIWKDKAALAKLAADADPAVTAPPTISVLAELMRRSDLDPSPLLSAARAKHPTDFELAFALGQWLANTTKDGQQIGPYEAARALRPEVIAVWNNLGIALRNKGDLDGALAAYKELVKLAPNDVQTYSNMGAILRDKGDLDDSIAAFKQAIKVDPKCLAAHNNLGIVLHDKGDSEGSIASFQEAIKLDPKNVSPHHNLGVALKRKGDLDGAIAAYEKVIQLDPSITLAHYNLGLALKDKGDVERAVAEYKEAIKLDFKFAGAHFSLGEIYYAQKKYPEAAVCAREATKADPKDAKAHALLGNCLLRTGDIPGARAAFTAAVGLDKKLTWLFAKLPPLDVAPAPRER